MDAAKLRWRSGFTGQCRMMVLAGYVPRWMWPIQPFLGRTGREQKFPPQFGQTFSRMFSTQERQKVHSNAQIIALVDSGGSAVLQCSQVGLNSSMMGGVSIFRWSRSGDWILRPGTTHWIAVGINLVRASLESQRYLLDHRRGDPGQDRLGAHRRPHHRATCRLRGCRTVHHFLARLRLSA